MALHTYVLQGCMRNDAQALLLCCGAVLEPDDPGEEGRQAARGPHPVLVLGEGQPERQPAAEAASGRAPVGWLLSA